MRRPPHRPLLRAAALAIAPALILTACSSTNDDAAQPSVTCGEIPTGTQIDSSAAPKSSQDISTRPEAATGYRTGMQPVQTNTYAAATANPLATKAACETLRDGGTAADALVAAQEWAWADADAATCDVDEARAFRRAEKSAAAYLTTACEKVIA